MAHEKHTIVFSITFHVIGAFPMTTSMATVYLLNLPYLTEHPEIVRGWIGPPGCSLPIAHA